MPLSISCFMLQNDTLSMPGDNKPGVQNFIIFSNQLNGDADEINPVGH